MPECWLKTNRRALGVAMTAPVLAVLMGGALAGWGYGHSVSSWQFVVGVLVMGMGLLGVVALLVAARIPRLAFDDGYLLVYLRSLAPLRVPIGAVEIFFLGQGPAHPADPDKPVAKTANVIVRIADSAADWRQRDVRPDLGQWCDGYITIRGLWCEPLSHERVNELNRRLADVHRQQSQRQEVS